MDPVKTSDLDPKLKEVYERVMGISSVSAIPAAPSFSNTNNPEPKTPIITTSPTNNVPLPIKPTLNVSAETINHPAPPAAAKIPMEAPISQTQKSEELVVNKKGISPILILAAGIVFFAVYSLFWLKFFNIKLPFLSF